jgi:4-amino-4-deoxy-L-arabinose transferase-like glycosyltransferase
VAPTRNFSLATESFPQKTWLVSPQRISQRIGLYLAILAFLHGLVYLALTPPWQAPDEPQHFQYVRFLLDERRLPNSQDETTDTPLAEEVRQSMIQFDFWTWRDHSTVPSTLGYQIAWAHPPLYYILAAVTLAPFPSLDVTTQLYIVRLFSLTLTALTVWVAYQAMRSLFPDSPALAAAVPLFIALLPMHAFLGSSVNNDALAELTATAIIWLLIEISRRGFTWQRGAWLVVGLATALVTKRTIFFLVPLAAIALLIAFSPRARRWLALAGALTIAALLGIALQYPGSYPGGLLRLAESVLHLSTRPGLADLALWGALLFTTFWGNFGWATVQLDAAWYGLLLIATAISGVGWVKLVWNWRRCLPALAPWQRWAGVICALAVLSVSAQTVALILMESIHQQARYLFPAIAPIALILVLGWGTWVPSRWRGRALGIGAALLVGFDLATLAVYQLPFYYG